MLGVLRYAKGAKLFAGVIAALIAGIGGMTWLWQGALERAANAEAQVQRSQTVIDTQAAEIRAFNQALQAQREREQRARARAAEAERRIQELEQSDETVQDWNRQRLPGGIRDWLREPSD